MPAYQVTGNEYVSLPAIREDTGPSRGRRCCIWGPKGAVGAVAAATSLRPRGAGGGQGKLAMPAGGGNAWCPWRRERRRAGVTLTYLCPLGSGPFCASGGGNRRMCRWRCGWACGQWTRTLHEVNETRTLDGRRTQEASGWNNAFVMQEVAGLPLCAFAPIAEAGG